MLIFDRELAAKAGPWPGPGRAGPGREIFFDDQGGHDKFDDIFWLTFVEHLFVTSITHFFVSF